MTKRVGSGTGSRVEPAPAMESAPVVKLVPAMESDMCMKVALKHLRTSQVVEEDQKFSNILVYQHDHAHLKQAGSVNSASSGDSTHGAGTSDSK